MQPKTIFKLLAMLALAPALGAQSTWTGANSSNWHDGNNWSPTGVPDASTDVILAVGINDPGLTNTHGSSTVTFSGASSLSSPEVPAFGHLTVASSASLNLAVTRLLVAGNWQSTGASVTGTGPIEFNGAGSLKADALPGIEISAGLRTAYNSNIGSLTLSGGELRIDDDDVLTVSGDAILSGGILGFGNYLAGLERLVVQGTVSVSGTVAGSHSGYARIDCYGNWSGNGSLLLGSGWVRLYGDGTLSGPSPAFAKLQLVSGTRTVSCASATRKPCRCWATPSSPPACSGSTATTPGSRPSTSRGT